MPSVAVEFDFAEVLPTIRTAHSRANVDDAEEAISIACVELLTKGTPLTAANVVTRARSRLRDRFRRREAGNSSLDAALDEDVDHARRELAVDEVDFDSHVQLREAADNPILAERLRRVAAGGSGSLVPRGTRSRTARYSDEQVAEVRRLREQGMKYADIEAATGVERSYAAGICRGDWRVVPSCDGWTDEMLVEAVQVFAAREGRPPTYQEGQQRPDLPNPSVLFGRGMTWRQLLDRAGHPSARSWRRCQPWTFEEAVRVIRDFAEREGRWPRKPDLRNPLPAMVTVRSLFGTWSMVKGQRIVEEAPSVVASADLRLA